MAVQARPFGSSRPRHASQARGREARRPAGSPGLRVLALLLVACVLAAAIWGRLAFWQVVENGKLRAQAASEQLSAVPLPAGRGVILDREGRPLAVNTTVYDVSVAPDQVGPEQRALVADTLAAELRVQADGVLALLESDRKFAYIAKREPKELSDEIAAMRLPGVYLQPQTQRTYLPGGTPDVSLASSLLGFVDHSGQGQSGVERYYQDQLGGRAGFASTYTDRDGRQIVLGPGKRQDPIDGSDLTLTVDRNIQFAAEKAIADGVQGNHATSGTVIILDTQSGGIVAQASYPGYDANRFASTDLARARDPAVSDLYEPGSVMKVVTLAGAIDSGKVTPQTVISDPGYLRVGDYTIRDWDLRAHGNVTMETVLNQSLNVGAMKAEQLEGQDTFFKYLRAFGLEGPSGVDLSGEASFPMRPTDQWPDTQVATASFGQGVAANAVQVCAAINAVANGGRWVRPHVVERIGNQPVPAPEGRQVISPQSAQTMTWMMRSVVQNGSGSRARVGGFELDEAGKTGTAQMPENGRYSDVHVWASYAGFLPADHPRFTMLVILNRPDNGSWDHNEGYYAAAPIWKRLAEQMILEWHLSPEPESSIR